MRTSIQYSSSGEPEPRVPRELPLGRIVATPGALAELDQESVLEGLRRHANCDWGNLGEEDLQANDQAALHGARVLSSYRARSGAELWVITEADRSVTTVLLPKEY